MTHIPLTALSALSDWPSSPRMPSAVLSGRRSPLIMLLTTPAMTHILRLAPEMTIPLSWSATLLSDLLVLPPPAAMFHILSAAPDLTILLALFLTPLSELLVLPTLAAMIHNFLTAPSPHSYLLELLPTPLSVVVNLQSTVLVLENFLIAPQTLSHPPLDWTIHHRPPETPCPAVLFLDLLELDFQPPPLALSPFLPRHSRSRYTLLRSALPFPSGINPPFRPS